MSTSISTNSSNTTLSTTTTTTTALLTSTTAATINPTVITTIITSAVTNLTSTFSPNGSNDVNSCLKKYTATCRFADFVGVLAYLLLSISLIPQIIHLFNHGSRYIAGISYMWIIIRVLGLASLMLAHPFKWSSSTVEFIALISTIAIFIQIFIYGDNLHRQQKVVLITTTLAIWMVGGGIILLARNNTNFLMNTGYLLLSVHMLPQILLNLLLRTAKALSKFSILFLALSDTLLFASAYVLYEDRYVYLITSYYGFSFFLFIYLQSLVYADSHIQLISRSAHTVLAPGVEIFSGLDPNGAQIPGQDPQMFSIDDLEPGDGTDVVYQPVTSNKSSQPLNEQTPMKRFVWYATLSSIATIEIILTVMIVARSPWLVLLPISIPVIIGIFTLLRTKLNVLQTEYLRKIL